MPKDSIKVAQGFIKANQIEGWLIYDYLNTNPIFNKVLPANGHITRPVFLLITPDTDPQLITHHVDQGRFNTQSIQILPYNNRQEMISNLKLILSNINEVAMEYSPLNELPRISRVDAGTVELVRSLDTAVISSSDIVQHTTQTWDDTQLDTHLDAGNKLGKIVNQAFSFIGENLSNQITEYDVAEYIRNLFRDNHLITSDGPVVAINENSADPHYEPNKKSKTFKHGDWVLIDLWAKKDIPNSIYSDITWVAYIGSKVPDSQKSIFDIVVEARDAALSFLKSKFNQNQTVQGWQVDQIARNVINSYGYSEYFTHRLGHGIGEDVHSEGVNLDNWETHDTRTIMQGSGFSIEPGIYLPKRFGMRSEIDVFVGPEGPDASSPVQTQVVLIN